MDLTQQIHIQPGIVCLQTDTQPTTILKTIRIFYLSFLSVISVSWKISNKQKENISHFSASANNSSLAPFLGYHFHGFPITVSILWDNILLHLKFCRACSNACSVSSQLTCSLTQLHYAEQQQEKDRVDNPPASNPCMLYL